MGPDEEVERDDKAPNTDTSDRGSDTARDDKPVSVRDSLRTAIREVESEDTDTDKDEKEIATKPAKEKKPKQAKVEDDNDEPDAGDDDTNLKEVKEPKKEVTAEVKAEPSKEKAPASVPKEVTDNWDKIPSSVQAYISKSVKDLTDTKSALGRREAQYRDMDTVLAQYEPSIRQLGVTPAQTVDRLFQWMNALAGPQKNMAIRQLANDFGISLEQSDQNTDTQQVNSQLPPELEQNIHALTNKVSFLEQQQEENRKKIAANTVNGWAGIQADGTFKNKPHFLKVRQAMYSLMASGAVPLIKDENGEDRLDLDGAYEAACYSNAEVRALLEQEKTAELKAKQEKDLEVKKQKDAEKIAAARKASGSIRPGAPARTVSGVPIKTNSKGQPTSVRDSIRAALRESAN